MALDSELSLDLNDTQRQRVTVGARTLAVLYFGVVALWSLCDPMHWSFLSSLILATHELGHVVFSPFGEWLMVAGGTILQLLAPIGAYLVLRRQREPTALFIGTAWFVTSLTNVATYVADARVQELPLVSLGGDTAEHDWGYLLGRANALASDTQIAYNLRGFAWGILIGVCMVYALRYIGSASRTREHTDPDERSAANGVATESPE